MDHCRFDELRSDPQTWVQLSNGWEHAEWIDEQWFARVLGPDLERQGFSQDSSVTISEAAKRVLRLKNVDFAAGKDAERFVSLVNRRKLLERLAERASEQEG